MIVCERKKNDILTAVDITSTKKNYVLSRMNWNAAFQIGQNGL